MTDHNSTNEYDNHNNPSTHLIAANQSIPCSNDVTSSEYKDNFDSNVVTSENNHKIPDQNYEEAIEKVLEERKGTKESAGYRGKSSMKRHRSTYSSFKMSMKLLARENTVYSRIS